MTQVYTPEPFEALEESRTSVLAILSLIAGLVCFIPGVGALGVILGVAALLLIGGSGGRLSGRGLAITGIVLGLLFSMLWIGAAIGVRQAFAEVNKAIIPMREAMVAFDAGDSTKIEKALADGNAVSAPAPKLAAFRDAYQREFGKFQSIPDGLLEMIQGSMKFAPVMQKYQQPGQMGGFIPIPSQFEKGEALILLAIPQNVQNPQGLPIADVVIESMDGKRVALSDFNDDGTLKAPAAAPADPAAPAPGQGEPESPAAPPADGKSDEKSGG